MADLAKLKAEQMAARELYRNIGSANVAGMSFEDQVETDLAYRRAEKAYMVACDAYNKAIEEAINGN